MKTGVYMLLFFPVWMVSAQKGSDLKGLIECFTWWDEGSATRPGSSQLEGCQTDDVLFCKTDKGVDDVFCKFHGDHHLTVANHTPECYFCCGMESCGAWDIPHDENQKRCIEVLMTTGFKN